MTTEARADLAYLPTQIAALAASAAGAPAVRDRTERLTFGELDASANRLAHHLRSLGAREGERVGLLLDRSAPAVVATLAVLRTGAAVVPLDPAAPAVRTAAVLAGTAPAVVVVSGEDSAALPASYLPHVVCLDRDGPAIAGCPATDPGAGITADTVSHVGYAAPGAGRAGAQVSQRHETLADLVAEVRRRYGVRVGDRATWVSEPGSALGSAEWLPFLAAGAEIHVLDAATISPAGLRDWLVARSVTHTVLDPDIAERLCGLSWPARTALRYLVVTGQRQQRRPPPGLPFEVAACGAGDEQAAHPDSRYDPFPLTETQLAYWIGRGDAVELGGMGCHGYWEWESADLDRDRFRSAWRRMLARHDMLRAVVIPDGTQRVLPDVPAYQIPVLDLRRASPESAEAQAGELRRALSHQVLRAEEFPLWDVRITLLPGGRTRLHLSLDLLIIDAWSYFQILVPELVSCYLDPAAELAPVELTFREYVLDAARARDGSARYRRSREYWLDRLDDLPPAPALPRAAAPEGAAGTPARFTRREHRLEAADWSLLTERAQRQAVTPSGIVVAAFAEVLRTWSTNDRFTINFPLFNRLPLHPHIDRLVGDFTTTSLLAVEKADGTFAERARSIQARMWADLEHRHFGGVEVMREIAQRRGGGVRASFPVVVTSLLGQPPKHVSTALGEAVYTSTQTPQVSLDFQVAEVEGALTFSWDSRDELFPPGLVDDMFGAYRRLLERLVGDEASWRAEHFPLVPAAQLAVRAAVNATDAPVPDRLLHQPVAEHAARSPDAVAVVSGTTRLTYAELSRRVNQVGRLLREYGARPGRLVGVVMDKGWEQIVAAHGVLASGAAYLPIDPRVPPARLRYLLDHGEVDIVLTQAAVDARLDWPPTTRRLRVDRDFDAVDPAELPPVQRATDLAYVVYTSGSTGTPKGVMVDHRGAVNTFADINERFAVGPGDACLAVSGLDFDLSVYDVFGMIAAGGTVVVPEQADRPDPERWADLVRRAGVTFWNSVPALLEMLVTHLEGGPACAPAEPPLRSMRLVILAGDWIPVTLPDRLRALAAPAPGDAAAGIQVVASGGPAESCVWSIINPLGAVDPSWPSIPYGKPMANQRYHVLDPRLLPRPVWVPGEIHIESRVGLAQGYWRDPERTAAAFSQVPGTDRRRYASGDVGRYLPDGGIEILGREDFQVKVQGHRIELGEIEAVLAQHPGVHRAVVVATGAARDRRRLLAFVTPAVTPTGTPAVTPAADGCLAAGELRRHVADRLPDPMVPAAFVVLDELPLTANGKVDRGALTAAAPAVGGRADAAPATPLEEIVADLWADLLGTGRPGLHDDLFALGGNSITATRFVARVRELFEVELPLRTVFAQPTVAGVCTALLADGAQAAGVVAMAEALWQLTDDDMDALASPDA